MWAKIDDRFPRHPKVLAAGGGAAWMYVAGLCYANEHLTDGRIPMAAVRSLTDLPSPEKLAAKLVEARLWERTAEGFLIHDYHDENDTADVVRAKREALKAKRSAAGVAGGRRSGEARAQAKPKQLASPVLDGCLDHVEAKPKPDADADADADAMIRKEPSRNAVAPAFDFAALYAIYPRKIGKTKGMAQCQRQIKTLGDFADLKRAIENYRASCAGKDLEYVKHFSSFMACWRDFIDAAALQSNGAQPSVMHPASVARLDALFAVKDD